MNDSKSTILSETEADSTFLGDSLTDVTNSSSVAVSSPTSGAKQRLRFGEVRVRTHKVTLGVNPSVSCGPPIELGWDHISSETFSIEDEFDELALSNNNNNKQALRRVSSNTREKWLRNNGHTSGSFRQVAQEIQEIKAPPKKRMGWRSSTKPVSVLVIQGELNDAKLQCPSIPKVQPGESASCPFSPDRAPKLPRRRTSADTPLGVDITKKDLKPVNKNATNNSQKVAPRLPFFSHLRLKHHGTD